MKRLLNQINQEVNDRIKRLHDDPGRDYWQHPDATIEKGTGDCEDIQLLKWKILIENDPKFEDIAYLQRCWDVDGAHVVLVVPGEYGVFKKKPCEWVLCNNYRKAMRKDKTRYKYMEFEDRTGRVRPLRSNMWTWTQAMDRVTN